MGNQTNPVEPISDTKAKNSEFHWNMYIFCILYTAGTSGLESKVDYDKFPSVGLVFWLLLEQSSSHWHGMR